MRLPIRLKAVAAELKGLESFADVGTDHGKLPVYALLNGIVKRAVATDISAPSLMKAVALAENSGVLLDTRLGNGFETLESNEVDAVVIAGMGGYEIIDIIDSGKTFGKYILLPHKHPIELRGYLKRKDIGILKDYVVKEGKFFYHLITCSIFYKWDNSHSVYIGRNNAESKDFAAYLEYRLGVLDKLIAKSGKDPSQAFERERSDLLKWQR